MLSENPTKGDEEEGGGLGEGERERGVDDGRIEGDGTAQETGRERREREVEEENVVEDGVGEETGERDEGEGGQEESAAEEMGAEGNEALEEATENSPTQSTAVAASQVELTPNSYLSPSLTSNPSTWEASKAPVESDPSFTRPDDRISAESAPQQNEVSTKPLELRQNRMKPETAEHVKELFEVIKKAAESQLIQHDKFILHLPIQLNTAAKGVTIDDLFKKTATDNSSELNRLAFDAQGNQKRLDEEQLRKIRKDGYFEVESQRYPGRTHVWRLSKFFAKGEKRLVKKLWYDMAAAVKLIMIGCSNRLFTAKPFSIAKGFLACLKALYYSVDLAIGLPYRKRDYGGRPNHIKKKKLEFTLNDAKLDEEEIDTWIANKRYLDRRAKLDDKGFGRNRDPDLQARQNPPKIPKCPTKLLLAEKHLSINVSLLQPDVSSVFRTHIQNMRSSFLKKNEKAYRSFALKKIQEGEKQELSCERIVENVNQELRIKFGTEFKEEIYKAENWDIPCSGLTENVMERFGGQAVFESQVRAMFQDFLDHQQVGLILAELQKEQKRAKTFHMEAMETHLEQHHPVLMKVSTWRRRRLVKEEESFETNNEEKHHQQAVEKLQAEGLESAAHLCQVEREFETKHRVAEEKAFDETAPIKESYCKYKRKIWLPQNWIVTEHKSNNYGPRYSVEKWSKLKVDQRLPFWRWTAYMVRTWAWMTNAMLYLILLIPFCSMFSLRALLSPTEFLLAGLDRNTGKVRPLEENRTRTMCSRIYDLWHHVFKYRRKFESGPDTGLLGRNCSRPLNVFWNYFVKGFCGTVILLTIFPALCLTISFTSLTLGLLCPILMPIISLLFSLFMVLIYDFDSPHGKRSVLPLFQYYVFLFLFEGLFQMIFAFLSGVIFIPLVALITFLSGCIWAASRACWDKCCLYTVLKPRGRVPAIDSWVAVRVSGPGLASNFLYQAKPQTILKALKIQLELDLLETYEKVTIRQIEQPGREFDQFFQQLREPFFADSGSHAKPEFRELISLKEKLKKEELAREMKARRATLVKNGIPRDVRKQVKLRAEDLQTTTACASKMLEMLIPYMMKYEVQTPAEEEAKRRQLFEGRGLKPDDWTMFAQQMLSEVFSTGILTPLEDSDEAFSLDAEMLEFGMLMDV